MRISLPAALAILGTSCGCWAPPRSTAENDANFVIDPALDHMARAYCIECHNPEQREGRFDLERLLAADANRSADEWQAVQRMLSQREMPPSDEPGVKRPSEREYEVAENALEALLTKLAPTVSRNGRRDAAFLAQYCYSCHNERENKGGLVLEGLTLQDPQLDPGTWEKVVRRLHARQMPPADRKRPSEKTYQAVLQSLTARLDARAAAHPKPGRTETFRRLNRFEYRNAVRDLLGVEIDAAALLPKDDASHGFDNVTIGALSPTLLESYISAARKISRLAIGTPLSAPQGRVYRVPADLTQEKHIEGLPIGTQGGTLIEHHFPQTGEYEFIVRLARDRNEHVEGLGESHEVDILIDRELVRRFTVSPPSEERRDHALVDRHLRVKTPVTAGPHRVGVTFPEKPYALLENKRKPHSAHFNHHRHPRISPAIFQVSINGPFSSEGADSTPSRKKILIRQPRDPSEEEAAAQEIIAKLLRRAYRRPVEPADLERPMQFYRQGSHEGGFDTGIEAALSAILVAPEFLFRVERDPKQAPAGGVYPVTDVELASRLSFFIWSSIPDEELLRRAIDGELHSPQVLDQQVRRMLADTRADSIVHNFADQWLYLRNLDSVKPDLRLFPDFDDNLRQAFRRETELLFESVLSEDRSVLDLIDADYTFLNERLAKHYGVPHIFGARFRRVHLDPEHHRGGILRHGSILTVTSYATRTSPTIRGNWILENLIGTPPPPPPPNVPALEDTPIDASLSMRDRLAEHRENPACASCHDLMDPVGFALENFDAVGRWRDFEHGRAIDASGGMPDGRIFSGVAELQEAIAARPELFVRTLSEKLLTYALGRGVEAGDAPAIRQIVRDAASSGYRFSSIIRAIVGSVPFQMRAVASQPHTAKNASP